MNCLKESRRLGRFPGPILFDAARESVVVGKIPTISHKMVKEPSASPMKQLFGTHENRLDAKGRVSVPAAFRKAWQHDADMTIVLRPSLLAGCVEGWPLPNYERFTAKAEAFAEADPDGEAYVSTVFSEAEEVDIDGQGRIMIPARLVSLANITEAVCFLGRGSHFQIWTPQAAVAFLAQGRARVQRPAAEPAAP
jgi:MraZ protein